MSLTLGEKLRQAREAKGITIGEVAEQTRISPLYIESIESDDYRALPGGIFNRGFVKSFAKYVGIDEHEALSDYSTLLYEIEGDVENVKFQRPEVLTDDRAPSSMLPTLIVAAVILGIMTVGVLFVLRQFQSGEPSSNVPQSKANTNSTDSNSVAETESTPLPQVPPPDFATIKVEFKAMGRPVPLTVTLDGKTSSNTITPGSTTTFEPKVSMKFSYPKWFGKFVQLAINGRNIILPTDAQNPKRVNIEFEINERTLGQIWNSGEIMTDAATANPTATANIESPTSQATPLDQIPVAPPRQGIAPNRVLRPPSGNRLTVTPNSSGAPRTPASTRPTPIGPR